MTTLTDTQQIYLRQLELSAEKLSKEELIELVMTLAKASVERDNQLKSMFQHPWFSGMTPPVQSYTPQAD